MERVATRPHAADRQAGPLEASGVSVTGLTKTFPGSTSPAVDDLDVTIEPGAFTSILGSSGCGKTTTLRMIAGLESPTAGEISVGGVTVFSSDRRINVPPYRRPISMVFQSYALWPHMSVFANIAYPLKRAGVAKGEIRERVRSVLALLKCGPLADRYPSQISGGQQQRIALGRAIVNPRSRVILFDEPLSNLDAKLREELRFDLRALQEELGFTALYVTHDQAEAMSMSDHVVVMRQGRIERAGDPESVFLRPRTEFMAEFFGGQNVVRGTVVRTDDSGVSVDTALGEVVVPADGSACPEVGAAIRISLPASSIEVVDGTERAPGAVTASVERASYFGDYSDLRVRVGDDDFRCRHGGARRFARDQRVGVLVTGSAGWIDPHGDSADAGK